MQGVSSTNHGTSVAEPIPPNNKMLLVAMKLKKSDFRSCQLPDTHTRSQAARGTPSCGFIIAHARQKPATP
jgi:hypothetical protein